MIHIVSTQNVDPSKPPFALCGAERPPSWKRDVAIANVAAAEKVLLCPLCHAEYCKRIAPAHWADLAAAGMPLPTDPVVLLFIQEQVAMVKIADPWEQDGDGWTRKQHRTSVQIAEGWEYNDACAHVYRSADDGCWLYDTETGNGQSSSSGNAKGAADTALRAAGWRLL